MAEDRAFKPLIKLTGMYENVSKRSGDTYFAGFLGGAKVMLFRDKNAEPGKPGWSLCVQEKEPKPDQGQGGSGYGQNQGQGQGYGQQNQGGYGLGRVIRPAPGKKDGLVVDLVDGHPFTLGMYRKRATIYRQRQWKIQKVAA